MRVYEIVLTPNGIATVWHNSLVPLKDEHLYRVYHEELGEYEYFYVKNGKKVTLTTSKDRKKNAKIHKYLRLLNKSNHKRSDKAVVDSVGVPFAVANGELVAID
ncbi:MAG: hypothetical protein RXO36_03685 [Candidatus Nanopusillus acidilobi]